MRKFGKIRIWPLFETLLPNLGPEPLSKSNVARALRSTNTRRPIKTVLLDQGVLAGIGNIYADEALFQSGIHPLNPFNRVPQSKMTILSRVIPQILKTAIEKFGTTIRNYHPPDTTQGEHQFYLQVYGKEGLACTVCGTKIEKIKINNRSSHFCPKCQLLLKNVSI
jgi:formamidopyrimidine-DNA glycosylase